MHLQITEKLKNCSLFRWLSGSSNSSLHLEYHFAVHCLIHVSLKKKIFSKLILIVTEFPVKDTFFLPKDSYHSEEVLQKNCNTGMALAYFTCNGAYYKYKWKEWSSIQICINTEVLVSFRSLSTTFQHQLHLVNGS